MALLDVTDLTVSFATDDGVVRAVDGLSLSIERGETLGLVGESGSGKSVACLALLGLLPGAAVSGSAVFEGRDLLALPSEELRGLRGRQIAMIFQDPLSSLHPHYRVGWQIAEAIRAHERVGRRQARARAVELLGTVGIPRPAARVDDHPHQFSGGMRQRVMIAMALALRPTLLIADEPTTALDVTVQAQILDLIALLQSELGTAVILVTHDLGVVAGAADRVLVLYAGKPVELADRRALYYEPHHPYTWGLLGSLPYGRPAPGARLRPIRGSPPSAIDRPAGCVFAPRCPHVMDVCTRVVPPLAGDTHLSACHLPLEDKRRIGRAEAAR